MAATTTSTMEIIEVNPAKTSDAKNSAPRSGPKDVDDTMLGNAMNASPMPPAATSSMGWPVACMRNPSAANTPMPASSSNPELANATTRPEPLRLVRRRR